MGWKSALTSYGEPQHGVRVGLWVSVWIPPRQESQVKSSIYYCNFFLSREIHLPR